MLTINDAVHYYKENIDRYWSNEEYKWAAVKTFEANWDIEASDFATMLEKSLSKVYNLLSGPMYYPNKMICNLANLKPEEVKELFRTLFDEDKTLTDRIKSFSSGCDELLKVYQEIPGHEKAKNHYQDVRAICAYLSFRYPEKYFLYKSQMYSDFVKIVDFAETSMETDWKIRRVYNFSKLCQEVINEVRKDPELVAMQQERVFNNEKYYPDPDFHLLAQTIIFVFPEFLDASEYWPSKEEYDPGITTEKWISILKDSSITTENNLQMFSMMLDYGKPATCSQLAARYKKSSNFFNAGSSSYAEKVAKKIGCPTPPESINENAKWWPILYVGRKATKDEKGGYVWKLRDELKSALEQIELPEIPVLSEDEVVNNNQFDHNIILYGPPGTGKTYNTVLYAVAIIEDKSLEEISDEARVDYKGVKKRYDAYKKSGQIAFTTFHQSYGYEEFIEGIRPVLKDDQEGDDPSDGFDEIEYELRSGIFKEFCDRASRPILKSQSSDQDLGLNMNPVVWKVSLEGAGENPTRKECLDNDHIRIGWDEYGPELTDKTEYSFGGKAILNAFYNRMRIGDVVLSCFSQSEIDAIGIVVGDPEWDDRYQYYKRVRRVKWIVKNIRENILQINDGAGMTLPTVYKMRVTINDALDVAKKYIAPNQAEQTNKYVFVIDEINRGNISKIFGELITLIEETKRIGQKEAIKVHLPYSGSEFGVPSNVYILGTMNTADRSIALMDTALRRRFSFVEMMPDCQVLRDKGADIVSADGETLDVAAMLDMINRRIEYLYDREHTIGHAFFIGLKDDPSIEKLASIFEKSVIPLLQEYFYEDYGKIQMVLGDDGMKSDEEREYQFIRDFDVKPSDLFKTIPEMELPNKRYIIQKEAFRKIESYKKIGKGL